VTSCGERKEIPEVVCCRERKEIPEVVREELQLLEVPVCCLSGEFSMGSHNGQRVQAHIRARLMFCSGFVNSLQPTSCLLMRRPSQGRVL
jgi:hypothetical protein